jgi:tetratricopeptide (TPR) repeat protein
MTMRYRAVTSAALVISVGLGSAACGRYSFTALKAQKAWKDANNLYKGSNWKDAADKYEYVLQLDPSRSEVYFYLGNSYDNAYKPARAGEPANDALLTKAIENYRKSAELDANPDMKKLALQYLVAAYGVEKLNDPEKAEAVLNQLIAGDPNETANYFQLSKLYEDAGRYEEAEKALLKAREKKPNDPGVYTSISNYYNRLGEFDKTMEALHKAADLNPNDPQAHQLVAVFYYDKSSKDHSLTPAKKREYAEKGIQASDRALGLNPSYFEALSYKNLLFRVMASVETDRAKQQDWIKKADELRNQAIELQKKKKAGT